MLVKLGDVWVDPAQVIYLCCRGNAVAMSVKEGGFIGAMEVSIADSREEAESKRDEFAFIINNTGQSFGGEDEATKP